MINYVIPAKAGIQPIYKMDPRVKPEDDGKSTNDKPC